MLDTVLIQNVTFTIETFIDVSSCRKHELIRMKEIKKYSLILVTTVC